MPQYIISVAAISTVLGPMVHKLYSSSCLRLCHALSFDKWRWQCVCVRACTCARVFVYACVTARDMFAGG